ncbi:MAG: class D sortase [Chloroflexi bacterium]|nr:class D sortase [Chloroflexota bacterium]
MARKAKSPELSESELRRLLMQRRAVDRKRRLETFERTGELLPLNKQPAEPIETDPLANPRVIPKDDLHLKGPPTLRSIWAARLLLLIEVLAVVGLVLIFLAGLNTLNELNNQVAAFFRIEATPSPTPLQPVVLPSGHTPPGEDGSAAPNQAEVPPDLLSQAQAYNAALVLPTSSPEQAQRITISAIDISAPIVQGDDWESLMRGVGQHIGTADPGQNGNLVLSGHNDIYGEVFRHLDRLKTGDEITVHTESRTYTYIVTDRLVVAPSFVEVLQPTENPTLTLISCYPYRIDTQRIIITASLQN